MKAPIITVALTITIALTVMAGTAHAAYWDGNMLLSKLRGNLVEQSIALGYVIGVSDTAEEVLHCSPNNATPGQIRDMVTNYLVNTPSDRHLNADAIVVKVLSTAWPCPKRRGSGS